VYTGIVRHAKRYWNGSPLRKVIAVLLVVAIMFAIAEVHYGLKDPFVLTVTGCSIKEDDANERSRVFMKLLEPQYGKSKPFGFGKDRIVYVQAQFDIVYVEMNDPCESFFSIRVPIQGAIASPVAPNRMQEVLNDPNLGGRYERGSGGSFVYDDDAKAYYLVYAMPMKQLIRSDLVSAVEARLRIGEAWRKGWFDAVGRMAMGEEPAPINSVVRPEKKDAGSVLPDMDEYLMDAGQQRNYRPNDR
jgi:hypothetical protein